MTTQQPEWKHVGTLGDVDPIAYGGGFVYEDVTGVYPPEVTWFEPAPDEQWHKTEGGTPLQVYRFMIERDAKREWWWAKLHEVADSSGIALGELQRMARATTTERAFVYETLLGYFGVHEFDSYPLEMTEDEAYVRYAEEMKLARTRTGR